jgi:ectoine hydroxylase-related dioxygenase (phytanoyl-CoA dioxygenase family)
LRSSSSCPTLVEKDGFVILQDLISADETSTLLQSLAPFEQRRSRAGMRHILGNPAIAALAHDSRMLGMAQEILGKSAFPFRATLFDKSPDANWLITWHQDTALPLRERRETAGWGSWSVKEGVTYAHAPASALNQVVALRLHLDDCNHENGPLRVVPGTHNMGVLNDDQISQLAAERNAVECVVGKGGVLAMRPLIVHASSKSQSTDPRRVLHIEYAAQLRVEADLQLAFA